jgi:hypothetical protein
MDVVTLKEQEGPGEHPSVWAQVDPGLLEYPRASLLLSDYIHMNVLNISYGCIFGHVQWI